MTTMSGDIGWAYRRNLNFGVKGLVVNVGDPMFFTSEKVPILLTKKYPL